MKLIIEGVVYNTETAELLADNWNGCDRSNFHFENEELYRTKKGKYFLHAEGGGLSKYAKIGYGFSSFGETISPLSDDEVFEFLQSWNKVELIETLFPDRIEEA